MKTILILVTLLVTFQVTHARDPILPDAPDYGERETVGGEDWSAGDTFLAITLPLAIIVTIALPHIFDGEYQGWPVHRFALFHQSVKTPLLVNKFPTRSQ